MSDKRSRKERLADPERWYRCVSIMDGEKTIDVEGIDLVVKGRIDDIIVVSIPSSVSGSAMDIARAMGEALQASGIARDVIVIPEEVGLVKLRPLSLAKSKQLDRSRRLRDIKRRVEAEKAN